MTSRPRTSQLVAAQVARLAGIVAVGAVACGAILAAWPTITGLLHPPPQALVQRYGGTATFAHWDRMTGIDVWRLRRSNWETSGTLVGVDERGDILEKGPLFLRVVTAEVPPAQAADLAARIFGDDPARIVSTPQSASTSDVATPSAPARRDGALVYWVRVGDGAGCFRRTVMLVTGDATIKTLEPCPGG